MSPISTASLRLPLQMAMGLSLLAMASCAAPPSTAAVTVPAIPTGEARAWFYRDPGPYDCQGTPYIRMNEAIVAVSQVGGASYRDVLPGEYQVAVDTYLTSPEQTRNVYLFPGQQVYFRVLCLQNWIAGGGGRSESNFQRDTFYVWQIPPEVAQGYVARSLFYGGS